MSCLVQAGVKTCNAPTSSFGDAGLIDAALSDPMAGTMTIKAFGYSWLSYTNAAFNGSTWTSTAGSMTFDGSEEEITISAGAITFQGNTYLFDRTHGDVFGKTSRSYCKAPYDCIYTVAMVPYEYQQANGYAQLVDLHKTQTDSTIVSGAGGSLTMTTHGQEWDAYIGLLTDRQRVVVPANSRISYSGTVYAIAGDGSPLGSWFRGGYAVCPITLTLDTSNGDIATPGASCTSDDGALLDFSLTTVIVEKSKVRPFVTADSAVASGFVMSGNKNPRTKTPFRFQSSKIGGGVYGSNAQTLTIFGSGPDGAFKIVGNRVP